MLNIFQYWPIILATLEFSVWKTKTKQLLTDFYLFIVIFNGEILGKGYISHSPFDEFSKIFFFFFGRQ